MLLVCVEAKMLLFVDQMPKDAYEKVKSLHLEVGALDFSFSYKCNFILEMCRWEDTFSFSFYFSDILKFLVLVLVFENV